MTVKKDPSTLEEELTLLLEKYKVTMILGAQAVLDQTRAWTMNPLTTITAARIATLALPSGKISTSSSTIAVIAEAEVIATLKRLSRTQPLRRIRNVNNVI